MSLHKEKSKFRGYMSSKVKKKPGEIWRDISKRVAKSRKNLSEVNVEKINKVTKKGEVIVVPGKVLGNGQIDHGITIGAIWFSHSAKEKIEKSGGVCMTIEELVEKYPDGKNVRIVG